VAIKVDPLGLAWALASRYCVPYFLSALGWPHVGAELDVGLDFFWSQVPTKKYKNFMDQNMFLSILD
jgi:hypothetical protein